jgi:soluble lytic murein transglycosylase
MRNVVTGTMIAFAVVVVVSGFRLVPPEGESSGSVPVASALRPTEHPPFPTALDEAWMVPPAGAPVPDGVRAFAAGVQRFNEGNHARTLIEMGTGLSSTGLSDYATYYTALAYLRLSRPAEARAVLDAMRSRPLVGYLAEAVPLAAADAASAAGDPRAALRLYEELAGPKATLSAEVLDRLARAAMQVGDRARANEAWLRLYYEFPLSPLASDAAAAVAEVRQQSNREGLKRLFTLDLARAERFFAARRYADARSAYERLLPLAIGDDAERVNLRIAACDHYLGRHRAAVDRLAPLLDRASRKAEARFFHLTALRAMGDLAGYEARARSLIAAFPDDSWTEEALNNLATHYIRANDDAAAARTFAQVLERFPMGRHAERAAWRLGWWRYKLGRHGEAAKIFEQAAVNAPRSDYRPAWIYWAGRARDRMSDRQAANARFELVAIDYLNTYYGRLASRVLEARGLTPGRAATGIVLAERAPNADSAVRGLLETPVEAAVLVTNGTARTSTVPPALPPNSPVIRLLIAGGLYDLAISELQYAQRTWGPLASADATLAWIHSQQGDMRRGINVMRRAYPQYMAVGGETLPKEVLAVIFPLDYWDLIKKHSAARNLDPYIVAALVAQESSFMPAVRSPANAYGLMQIIPSTGRLLARAEGLGPFSIKMLTNPELNVRMGTRHFAGLIRRFGGVHYALASYNAGESRIVRWKAERPGLDQDEFIDDIPFPETQIYVKKILGTAEDYRRLYGPGGIKPPARVPGLTPTASRPPASTSGAAARTPASTAKKPASTAKKPASTAKRPAAPAAKKPASSGTKKPAAAPAKKPPEKSGT